MRLIALLGAALLAAGCVRLSFAREDEDARRLRGEIHAYYAEVAAAFATGSAEALAARFDPAIAKPMTHARIREWGEGFFGEHGPASFKAEKVEFESLGYREAVVVLTYRVKTRSGKGDFAGVERDFLVKRNGRWAVSAWDKLSK